MILEPIFPGMDPFIEDPDWWLDFHNEMITRIRGALAYLLVPRYTVVSETYIHMYVRPDVSILRGRPDTEPLHISNVQVAEATRYITPAISNPDEPLHVEIIDEFGQLTTVIELLSPSNKLKHQDRYLANRDRILNSDAVHLVEIDLLRGGKRMEPNLPIEGYVILVARARKNAPHQGELYEIGLRDPLPVIPVPLRPDDADVPLELPRLFREAYIHALYRFQLDYTRPPAVPFSEADAAWVAQLLKEANV